MKAESTEQEILAVHGMFNPTLDKLLKCPVPFTLTMYGGGEYAANGNPRYPLTAYQRSLLVQAEHLRLPQWYGFGLLCMRPGLWHRLYRPTTMKV